jgi:hypothetical protein
MMFDLYLFVVLICLGILLEGNSIRGKQIFDKYRYMVFQAVLMKCDHKGVIMKAVM